MLRVLEELKATEQPIITALNKIDQLPNADEILGGDTDLKYSVAISALTGQGLPDLVTMLEEVLDEDLVSINVLLPYQRGDLVGLIHQRGVVTRETHDEAGTRITAKLPASLASRFEAYLIGPTAGRI